MIKTITIVLLLLSLFVVVASRPHQPADTEALEGIWFSETTFGPQLQGELVITRAGTRWDGRLADAKSSARVNARQIQLQFRGDSFRGALTRDGKFIEGFWLQDPSGVADRRDPGGTGQRFATPLTLQRVARDTWKGTVKPLESRFTLYLKIFRDARGSVIAAFRNPDMNARGGASQFGVTSDGKNIRFAARPDPSVPELALTATLESPDRMRMVWPDLGFAIDLVRRVPSQVNFFPRPPGTKYTYHQPEMLNDGWTTARARDAGMDEERLARLVQRLADSDPADRRPNLIHSVLVAYRGKLVLEEYFFGFQRDQPHDTRSAGKTFASVMLGAAMRSGFNINPNSHIYDFFGGVDRFANRDPRKLQITLAHLMTHTAGLACDDNDNDSPGNEGTMQSQEKELDWWKYTLDLPMAHNPGQRYAYCSANSNLVGGALTKATRTWLPEFFDRKIARPLQFGRYHWNLMPTGEGYQGGGAFLRPRDLLKVGQMFLDGGIWNGRRIVDASWVKESTAPRVHISPATTGLSADQFSNSYGEADDAYMWHLGKLKIGDEVYDDYAATGNGGQLLIVVPKAQLVVVFTGGNMGQGGIWSRWRSEIVPKEIIPAVQNRER